MRCKHCGCDTEALAYDAAVKRSGIFLVSPYNTKVLILNGEVRNLTDGAPTVGARNLLYVPTADTFRVLYDPNGRIQSVEV